MSESPLTAYFKADISFYRAYQKARLISRLEILAHMLQIIALVIFIPIDLALLQHRTMVIAAEGVALGVALFACVYQSYFKSDALLTYCQIARDTQHVTQQPIAGAESESDCTSGTVYSSQFPRSREQVFSEEQRQKFELKAFEHIISAQLDRFGIKRCLQPIETILTLSSIVVVAVLMAKSEYINSAEIAVLSSFLVIQAITKFAFVVIAGAIAVFPITGIVMLIHYCCCQQKPKNQQILNKEAVKALPEDVQNCNQCSICSKQIAVGDDIYNEFSCSQNHIFHKKCLDEWFQLKKHCPTCQRSLPLKIIIGQSQFAPQTQMRLQRHTRYGLY